ncbi:DUF4845 domain-containing protein [Pseudohalioglobus sediminis]|uniref:DUF4845 domain-containing protein n=1 Tax=Pseudohalioglobus sediminis TaxID=2606449 RepID=A0A5B0X3R2_9GAMM|nr:DUF4845 domain-containing protein [Pseudohalioglobus sediminis]KAA1193345.1 DUF4845 domain-containing protein [Pseudohalioglobus sediminis]
MRTPQRQRGMSIPGMLIIAIMAGFYVMCFVKMVPHYFEYTSVKNIVQTVADEHEPGSTTVGQVRRRIDRLFNTNQIYALKVGDVDIYREKGVTYIDARYEARVPLAWRIDAVMKFDDLLIEAGKPEPR